MESPNSIIQQVLKGTIPPTWRVFRGQGSPLATAIFMGFFTFIFTSVLLSFITGCAFFVGIFQVFTANSSPDPNLPVNSSPPIVMSPDPGNVLPLFFSLTPFAFLWLIPVLLALLVAFRTFRRAQAARDSLLVITPEGVVQCQNVYMPERSRYDWLDFSAISAIRLRIHTSDTTSMTTDPNTGMTSSHVTGQRTDLWLDVQYAAGSAQRWSIPSLYGTPADIAQDIIEAFTRFRVTRG